jgi:hypothetical protein
MSLFTLFTSYRREDAAQIEGIEQQLRLRGVRSWRDVRNLEHGAATPEQIRRAIRLETAGFLAFVTKSYLERRRDREDVVWGLELPEAAARWKAGGYPLTPLFSGTRSAALAARCAEEGLPDLSTANGGHAPECPASPDELAAAFQSEARAQLRNAIIRSDGPLVIAFRSFPMASLPANARLDIDWTAEIDGGTADVWSQQLLPALDDLKGAISTAGVRHLAVHVLTRLGAALAFGIKFPLASGIALVCHGRDGEAWDEDKEGPARPLREDRVAYEGDGAVAILELSIVRDLGRDATELALRVHAAHHVRLSTAGADRSTDPRPIARAIAQQVGDVARTLQSTGVTDLHVLLASPAPLALLIGRQLHALGRVHIYYRDENGHTTRAYSMVA